MEKMIKLAIGLAMLTPLMFGGACSTWDLGNGVTTIAPGTAATGSNGDPCTLGGDTFSNFYVYNTAASDGNIVVGASFTAPDMLTFGVVGVDATTDFDVLFEVQPGQSSLTVADAAQSGEIFDTVCSVRFTEGQSCAGQGGVLLGNAFIGNSTTQTFTLAPSPTGQDWVFEDIAGTSSFSKSFPGSTTPEPVTSALAGVGLLLLGLFRMKFNRKA